MVLAQLRSQLRPKFIDYIQIITIYYHLLKMQKFRFSNLAIYIHEKHVQYCGKTIKKSKKKVKWVVSHGSVKHTIEGIISFNSGKKKLFHNQMKVMDVEGSQQYLQAVVMFGLHRVSLRIDRDTETLRMEEFASKKDVFQSFKNVFSSDTSNVYENYFSIDIEQIIKNI